MEDMVSVSVRLPIPQLFQLNLVVGQIFKTNFDFQCRYENVNLANKTTYMYNIIISSIYFFFITDLIY